MLNGGEKTRKYAMKVVKKHVRVRRKSYSSIPPSTFYLIHHSMGTGIGYHLGNSLSYNKTTVQTEEPRPRHGPLPTATTTKPT